MVEVWHFFIFSSSAVTKRFDFFNSSKLSWKDFVVLLVLAHLEPELELFEADDIGGDGDADL